MRLELCALLLTAAVGDSDAEKLYRALETTISKAKTLQFSFEATVEGMLAAKMKGKVAIAEGNKARLEFGGEFGGKSGKVLIVSDGVKSKTIQEDGARKIDEKDTPKNFTKNLVTLTRSFGLAAGLIIAEQPEDDFAARILIDDFKLGKKEMVGNRLAQIITFRVGPKTPNDFNTAAMRVWVDTQTHVPLKQIFEIGAGDAKVTVTQINTDMRIDEKIDAKLFELPK